MYLCEFPFCEYSTNLRSKIHQHHILPKEQNGNNSSSNLIFLCANCHNKIYIKTSKQGQHSIKDENSIEIIRRYKSTNGLVIFYHKIKDNLNYFYFYNTKEEFPE